MSLGCGCGSYTHINRIINANVCQNYFIIIDVACATPTNISTPNYGTAEIYGNGQIIYTHTDNEYVSETDSFTFKCNGVIYTVNLNIEQTIPPTTTIVTFSATGTCEVGNVSYTWTLPDCATLVEGYNIHDQVIEAIVPMFDPENPTAVCILTVDVCCDYCNDCCKCETIEWYPPNCTLECGEDPTCNCNHLNCHVYNPLTGNCEPTCESDEVCCLIGGNIVTLGMSCEQIDSQNYTMTITADTYNVGNRWLLGSINDVIQENTCLNIPLEDMVWTTGVTSVSIGESGELTITPVNPTSLTIDIASDGIPGGGVIFIGLLTNECTVVYAFQVLASAQQNESNHCLGTFEFNNYYITNNDGYEPHYPICNECTQDDSFCAECCDTDDCYIAGCPNTNMICYNNACYCILNDGSYIPAPTDGSCCPSCTDDSIPDCYECIDGVIVPPSPCPVGQIYDWDTCSCTGTPCSTLNCLNAESPLYCPDVLECGCLDVPNSIIDVCVPCNSVSCTGNIDCPIGCYCLDGTCTGNPCSSFDCINDSPEVYCPYQEEGCFCEDTTCLPCNTVSCTGNIDCPLGCMCDENEQVCIANPCITAEVECDAYFLHHESDLTLTKTCVGNSYYLITPALALEPNVLPSDGNTTWWVNLSNYVDGWYEVTGSVVISGVTAIQKVGGKLKIFYAANINYISIMCLMNGRKIWYRLNGITDEGVGCQYATLDLGGAFLCGEIFTIESNSGIEWSVNEWFVTSGDVTYSSTGENAVLVIECAGTETVGLSAEITNGECTISTCEEEYECNCTGSKDCDKYEINFNENFNQNTYVWNINADVLYEGVTGFAWYDCELPNALQLPTGYTCINCGGNPYLSMDIITPTGDDGTNTEPPNCYNPTANNNDCNCICGWTFYGANLISHAGAAIVLQVTDLLNAQVCFQTDIAGTDAEGPCCVSGCLNLEFVPTCNLNISANIDCFTVGNYIVSFSVIGNLLDSYITNVVVNGNSIDFTEYDDIITFIYEGTPNTILDITATDNYGCTASTAILTPCCEISYNIEEITCFEKFETNCQSCGITGDNLVIGYNFTFYGLPLPYQLYMHTNDSTINAIFPPQGISVNTYTYNVEQQVLNCSGLVINELWINSQGCQTYLVSSGQFCNEDICYHGVWKHVGSNIEFWNNPNSQGYINYVFTGIQVGDNLPILFQSFNLNPIDLQAIICQAHKDAGTSDCNQNTYTTIGCAESISSGTTCYLDSPPGPPNCINDNFPSHVLKNYHNNIVTLIYNAWQCRLQNNAFRNAINAQLVAAGYPGTFNLLKLIIPSNPNPNVTLPDGDYPNQLSVYQYYIITDQRYETGFIKPVRNTFTQTVPEKPVIILGCRPGECFDVEQGYNCGNCTLLVDNGQYATSAECLMYCTTATPCETSEYGYNCGTCSSLSYNGEYATIEDCNANCNDCVTASYTYDCNTSGFTYYIETPPLDNLVDSYSAAIPITGINNISIQPDRIIINGVTTLQDNTTGNVIVSGTIITTPWTWTYPSNYNNPLMFITIVNTMTDCITGTTYAVVPMMCDYATTPLNGNIDFSCELDELGGIYLVSISASGGYPAYYFKLEYIVNGISYYQQSYTDMLWWDGNAIQLNIGNTVPDSIILTITDYYNECVTLEYTPNCLYVCNDDYFAPSGQLLVDILIDFSESSATNIIDDMLPDTGYDTVAKLHFEAVKELFDYYYNNANLLNLANKLSFRLFIYSGPGIYQCINSGGYSIVCPTSVTNLNSAFVNNSYYFGPGASNAEMVNLKTIINNAEFCFTDVSGNFIIDGGDTIMCAIQKSFSTMTNYNKIAIVLTDIRTEGPDSVACGSGNCTTFTWDTWSPSTYYNIQGLLPSYNKVDIIHSGLYPYHRIVNAVENAVHHTYGNNYLFPMNRYWSKYGVNKVHVLNRPPSEIADFIKYLINYKMSGNQLPCYTVDYTIDNAYISCNDACNPPITLGYDCGDCQTIVVNGEYANSIECEEVCQSQQCGWIATSSCGMVNGNRLITITINASNQILSNILPITITIGGCTNSQFVVLTENDFVNGIYTHQFICLGVNVINIIITDDDNCIYTNDIPTCDSQVDNLCDFVDGSGDIILIPDEGSPNRHIYVPDWIDGDIPNLIN